MKEIKTFFSKDNRLNKGYTELANSRENDNSFYQKQLAHILPPIDVISEFENLHPGTLARIMDMAEKEQHHRHALDLVSLDAQSRAIKMGRICALILVSAICITTIALAILAHTIIALAFGGLAFASIAAISFSPLRRLFKKNEPEPNFKKTNSNMRRRIKR